MGNARLTPLEEEFMRRFLAQAEVANGELTVRINPTGHPEQDAKVLRTIVLIFDRYDRRLGRDGYKLPPDFDTYDVGPDYAP